MRRRLVLGIAVLCLAATASALPATAAPAARPAPVSDLHAYDLGKSVRLKWTNPSGRFHRVALRWRHGKTAPTSLGQGKAAQPAHHKSTTALLHPLSPGATYSVSVWTVRAHHVLSARRSLHFTTAANPSAGQAVRGLITDEASQPLQHALVSAFNLNTGDVSTASTDTYGRYQLRLLPGRYDITAFGPNAKGGDADSTGYTYNGRQVRVRGSSSLQLAPIRLSPGGLLHGRVTDAHGHGIPGVVPALVQPPTYELPEAGGWYWPYDAYDGARTNARGYYTIRGVDHSAYIVCLEPTTAAYARGCLTNPVSVPPKAAMSAPSFTLARAATGVVRGIVTDPAGRPVREADVEILKASNRRLIAELTAGNDGSYAAYRLAPGTYRVCVDTDFAPQRPHSPGVIRGCHKKLVAVSAGVASVANVTLRYGAAFDGTVRGPGGRPVAGATILVDLPDEADYVATTDQHGHYLAQGVRLHHWRVCVDTAGAHTRGVPTGPRPTCLSRKPHLQRGRILTGINMRVGVGAALAVRVTDTSGRPERNAEVDISQSTQSLLGEYEMLYTDNHGRAGIAGLPPGSYSVCVGTQPEGGANVWACSRQVIHLHKGRTTTYRSTFPDGGTIALRVQDSAGRPVAGVDAIVLGKCTADDLFCAKQPVFSATKKAAVRASGDTWSDGETNFAELPPGRYAVCALGYWAATTANDAPTGYADVCSGSTMTVTVQRHRTSNVSLVLPHGGAVSGTVTDASGSPISGARVHISGSAADDHTATWGLPWNINFNPAADSVTGKNGTFWVRSIQPGQQTVCVTVPKADAPPSGKRTTCLSGTVGVQADKTTAGINVHT